MFSVFWAEAGQMENAKERERAGKRALKADDAKQLKAMIELAAAQPGIAARPELFDSTRGFWAYEIESLTCGQEIFALHDERTTSPNRLGPNTSR
jgi:hypothetical protein